MLRPEGLTRRQMLLASAAACFVAAAPGQSFGVGAPRPNLAGNVSRPLRYRPEGTDFVIANGAETFNRPLYGGHSAFRVDGGDKPEFVLYLPGRGGNLRLAIRTQAGARWLHEAQDIVARYRPGELHYEIRDPAFDGPIRLAASAAMGCDGLLLRVESAGAAELIWVFGGVNGERGARDGDIGTERIPISEWFRFKPEFAADNRIEIAADGAKVSSPAATIHCVASEASQRTIADGAKWNDLTALLASSKPDVAQPVAVGRADLMPSQPHFLLFQVAESRAAPDLPVYREVSAPPSPAAAAPRDLYSAGELAGLFEANARAFAGLRRQVHIETPDAYINAAAAALNVAADALWDGGALLHGAIAWRTRLPGWRGPYVLDALGWHERARTNFSVWTQRQNLDPVRPGIPPADERFHLARNETGLHSNGDLAHSHYDMNLVLIDALLRHLMWTGDKDYALEVWPVIERHLAWERRLFRRDFDGLPLYEAYAAIWASDNIAYSGGGAACASAYNLFHNRMAARIARWIGKDGAPYRREAAHTAQARKKHRRSEKRGALGA
jgi:hypothetical protein